MLPINDTTDSYYNNSHDSSDSDDDVLQAVLAFVESFDHGDHHHHQPPPKPSASRKSPTRKRHSSERIRSEIEALRELAVQLEDRLAHLQFEQAARTNASRQVGEAPDSWAIEALRQEQQRLQSEMENLQLKAVVEAQSKVAQRLEILFERRVRHQGQDAEISARLSRTSLVENQHGIDDVAAVHFTPTDSLTEPASPNQYEGATHR